MSATLLGASTNEDDKQDEGEPSTTGAKLLKVLGGDETCNILQSEGRQYPITIQHSGRMNPRHAALFRDTKLLVKTMADAIEEGLLKAPEKGDVLAFLPGAKEILSLGAGDKPIVRVFNKLDFSVVLKLLITVTVYRQNLEIRRRMKQTKLNTGQPSVEVVMRRKKYYVDLHCCLVIDYDV